MSIFFNFGDDDDDIEIKPYIVPKETTDKLTEEELQIFKAVENPKIKIYVVADFVRRVELTKEEFAKIYPSPMENYEMDEKLTWIEFRIGTGTIQATFVGRDFVPDENIKDWPWFRVISPDKNTAIAEMIAKLESLKNE